jgi:hypothetical protein
LRTTVNVRGATRGSDAGAAADERVGADRVIRADELVARGLGRCVGEVGVAGGDVTTGALRVDGAARTLAAAPWPLVEAADVPHPAARRPAATTIPTRCTALPSHAGRSVPRRRWLVAVPGRPMRRLESTPRVR